MINNKILNKKLQRLHNINYLSKKTKRFSNTISLIRFSLKQLIAANAHLGYESNRWNPELKPFLWGVRNNMHVLNIQETSLVLRRVFAFTIGLIKLRKSILFSSENKHIDHLLKKIILLEQQCVSSNRWIGGILTNFRQIQKNTRMLSDAYNTRIKYNLLSNRRKKLKLSLEGLYFLNQLPSLVIVLNGVKSKWVINEVISQNIVCAAIVDSATTTKEKINFPIPGNVYGLATQVLYVKLFMLLIRNACLQEILLFSSLVNKLKVWAKLLKPTVKFAKKELNIRSAFVSKALQASPERVTFTIGKSNSKI